MIAAITLAVAAPALAVDPQLGESPRFEGLPRAAFEPSTASLLSGDGLAVDTGDRSAVAAFFESYYLTAFVPAMSWTGGSVATCDPGQTSLAYEDVTLQLVNFYRAMAGLPGNVQLDAGLNGSCQEAALMMSAERDISHAPAPEWACYTAAAGMAAARSNLALGLAGPHAIRAYIEDFGDTNEAVGHRRWILYPPQTTMGTGSVPGAWQANCLWIVDHLSWMPPENAPDWVAWPPPGYVPHELIYDRWSFSMTDADFSQASVTVSLDGEKLPVVVLPVAGNTADNTVVWEPEGVVVGEGIADKPYWVRVYFEMGGSARTVSYVVHAIDRLPEPDAHSAAVASLATLAALARRARRAASYHQCLR